MTDIELVIKALTSDAQKAIGGLTEGIKGLGESGGLLGGLGGALGTIGSIAGGIATAGVSALSGVLMDSIQAAADAEKGQAALASVLASTKGAAGITADAANELASSLQKVTPFEDDVVLGAENMLLTFTNIHANVFPKATETVLNLAQAMGGDAKGAAMQLGKALNDPEKGISALTRVGVTFTEEQKAQIKAMQEAGDMAGAQGIILKELETEFGGAARAAGGTFAGQMAIAQNALGDLKEALGAQLLPIITPVIQQLTRIASEVMPMIADAIASAGPIFGTLKDIVLDAIGFVSSLFLDGTEPFDYWIGALLTDFGMGKDAAFAISDTIASVFNTIKGILFDGGGAVDGLTAIWFQAKTDIGIIINALMTIWRTEFNSALAFFDENSADIQATFQTAWAQIKTIVGTAVTIVETVLTALAGFISAHGAEITGMFKGAWEVIKGIIDGTLTLISGILTAALQLMNGDTSGALETLKGTFTRVWEDIKGIVKGAWDFISNIVNMAIDAIGRLSGARSSANAAGAMGGGMTTQSVRAAPSFALGGDTYNISGDMNTAKQIQAQRKQAARSATLRMAWG